MTTPDPNTMREAVHLLNNEWLEDDSALDEQVHDLKAGEAAGINNEGVTSQIAYLTGLTEAQVDAILQMDDVLPPTPSQLQVELESDDIYLSDAQGEIVMWTQEEWKDDPSIVLAIVNAVVIGLTQGPAALRARLAQGATL